MTVCRLSRKRSRPSQDEQLPGDGREEFSRPCPGTYHQGVFDPDTALARKVDPWLDGDGNPVPECTRRVMVHQRRLVDLQADAVAEPVPEMPAVTGTGDDVAGRGVHGRDVRAGFRRVDAHLLRRGHE